MYIDTHAHLHDPKFPDIEEVVYEYQKFGVDKALNMGCCLETSVGGKTLSEKFESIYFGAGYHPSDANDWDNQNAIEIEKLLSHEKCVAVGEIGLDYHYGNENKDKQKACFIEQLELAKSYKLPVSIHSRDATLNTITLLKENKDKLVYGGVLHCFSGSVETVKEYLKLGLYIGFGGTLTFKNARSVLEVAEYLPLDRCLTETDCPYLSPEPYRGQRNSPKNIPIIVDKLATVKGIDVECVKETVYQNALNLFNKISK